MLRALKKLGEFLFEKPSLASIAREELYSAERELMQLKTAREYSLGLIDFREKQIARLKSYLQTLETTK